MNTDIDNRIILQSILRETQRVLRQTSTTTYIYPCPIETKFIYQQIKNVSINEDIFHVSDCSGAIKRTYSIHHT